MLPALSHSRPLTGSCFSRQMLNVLVWLGFSFFRGTRVSPMNSLCRNLSSSHTEILGGKGTASSQTHGCSPWVCKRWAGWAWLGGCGWGGSLRPGALTHRRVFRIMSSSVIP